MTACWDYMDIHSFNRSPFSSKSCDQFVGQHRPTFGSVITHNKNFISNHVEVKLIDKDMSYAEGKEVERASGECLRLGVILNEIHGGERKIVVRSRPSAAFRKTQPLSSFVDANEVSLVECSDMTDPFDPDSVNLARLTTSTGYMGRRGAFGKKLERAGLRRYCAKAIASLLFRNVVAS